MSKKIFALILFLVLLAALLFVSKQPERNSSTEKLQISTSFYPLYFFTSQIVGEQAVVLNLSRAGVDPHDFEPSISDLRSISNSQLLVINGLGFEAWLEKFADQLGEQVTILATAPDLAYLDGNNHYHEKDDHEEEEEHEEKDPHVWLDPVLARKQVELISAKLIELDSDNATYYRNNTEELLGKLDQLDTEFKQGLVSCRQRNVVTAHAAFAYLAARYKLTQIAIQGLSHEEEPTPAKLAEVSHLAKTQDIKYIFFENLLSPKLAETIATEVGAATLIFHPLENLTLAEEKSGADYFSLQRQNLTNLRLALQCS